MPESEREDADIHIAHCPERVLPGSVLRELVDNDRIIGGISPYCAEYAAALYRSFVRGEMHLTNARTAELAKLVENAYRDVNIAFANELSIVCDQLGINVWDLIALANKHPRVNILSPGPGVGGHCIAVDPWFIIAAAPQSTPVMRAARDVNDGKPDVVFEKVKAAADRYAQPGDCLSWSFLQGRYRRSARKSGTAHRRSPGARKYGRTARRRAKRKAASKQFTGQTGRPSGGIA